MRRALTASCVLCASATAAAHLTTGLTTTNRCLDVEVTAGRLSLGYALSFGGRPAQGERRRMDADRDARISPSEIDAWLGALREELRREVRVSLDGRPLALDLAGRVLLDDVRLGDIPFLVELRSEAGLGAGDHVLLIDDRFEPPDPGEHEVRIREGPGARFLASRRGAGPHGPERGFTFRGRRRSVLEDRTIAFRFETDPGPPPAPRAPEDPPAGTWPWALAAAVAAGAIGAAVWLWRRRESGRAV